MTPFHRVLALLFVLFLIPHMASGDEGQTSNLRFDDVVVRDAFVRGMASPTFRRLVRQIEASDLIVWIDRAVPRRQRAGRTRFLGAAGTVRFAHVAVRIVRADDEDAALLGHELQHAVELAEAPWVTDEAGYRRLYEGLGGATCGPPRFCFDTREARHAGRAVLHELREKALGLTPGAIPVHR